MIQKVKRNIRRYFDKLRGRIDYDSIDLRKIDYDLIVRICENEAQKSQAPINEILKYDQTTTGMALNGEKGFPGEPEFVSSGHSRVMLNRYLFAAQCFCKNMNVLDSCCGFGWGAYLVSHYAHKISAFDCDPEVIRFCRQTWPGRKIKWRVGDALDLSFLGGKTFDCILAMETVEHFSRQEGSVYIKNLHARLRGGGILVGSTPIAHNLEYALELMQENPYHLTVYTYHELRSLLQQYFREAHIVKNWMFFARK